MEEAVAEAAVEVAEVHREVVEVHAQHDVD
jgi:hypothetical protein